MMKSKDVAVATSLVIQGYMRANDEGDKALADALEAIRRECDDWSESLTQTNPNIEVHAVDVIYISGIEIRVGQSNVPRTPYNLISAAIALIGEAVDLVGDTAHTNLLSRMPSLRDAALERAPVARADS